MQFFKKQFSYLLVFVIGGLLIFSACKSEVSYSHKYTSGNSKKGKLDIYNSKDSCKKQVKKLLAFAEKNNCNKNLFFIIDLEQHSGKKRFFVFDNQKDSVMASGLVAQGQGKILSEKPAYSNVWKLLQ